MHLRLGRARGKLSVPSLLQLGVRTQLDRWRAPRLNREG
jgi:hypothetical protein